MPIEKDLKPATRLVAELQYGVAQGMLQTAVAIQSQAQRDAPRDTGWLESHTSINPPSASEIAVKGLDSKMDVTVSFDVPYAAYQDRGERADGSHKIVNRPAGGKTHFFEAAMLAKTPELPAIVTAAVMARIKKLG